MDDLFRFVLLRPSNLPSSGDLKTLEPRRPRRHGPAAGGAQARGRVASVRARGPERRRADLRRGRGARPGGARGPSAAARRRARDGARRDGIGPGGARSRTEFVDDERRLADTLVATKLVSDSAGTDARGLADAARGYDAIRAAAAGRDPVALRPLVMPAFGPAAGPGAPGGAPREFPDRRLTAGARVAPASPPDDAAAMHETGLGTGEAVERLDETLAALSALPAESFCGPGSASAPQPLIRSPRSTAEAIPTPARTRPPAACGLRGGSRQPCRTSRPGRAARLRRWGSTPRRWPCPRSSRGCRSCARRASGRPDWLAAEGARHPPARRCLARHRTGQRLRRTAGLKTCRRATATSDRSASATCSWSSSTSCATRAATSRTWRTC